MKDGLSKVIPGDVRKGGLRVRDRYFADRPGHPKAGSSIKGVGPDTPVVTNENGGEQSDLPYAFHLMDSKALFKLADVLHYGIQRGYKRDN